MGNEKVDAVFAKALYEQLMIGHGARYAKAPIAEYLLLELHEQAEDRLDELQPVLSGIAEDYRFSYEKPMLTEAGEKLVTSSSMEFVSEYANVLRESLRGPMPGFVCI